jgi:hypothetical protein
VSDSGLIALRKRPKKVDCRKAIYKQLPNGAYPIYEIQTRFNISNISIDYQPTNLQRVAYIHFYGTDDGGDRYDFYVPNKTRRNVPLWYERLNVQKTIWMHGKRFIKLNTGRFNGRFTDATNSTHLIFDNKPICRKRRKNEQ